MSKMGECIIEEILDKVPNGNFMYEYNDKYDTYTIYFRGQDEYAVIEDLTEMEVITIASALYEMCKKVDNG